LCSIGGHFTYIEAHVLRDDDLAWQSRTQSIENTLDALTHEALRPINPDKQALDLTRALTDLHTWKAFNQRGLSQHETIEAVTRLIASAVANNTKRI
jgi:hypothetical protein